MIDKKHLLTSKQMARFVTDGYLRFDEIVPPEVNKAALAEYDDKEFKRGGGYMGSPLADQWTGSSGVGAIFKVPAVQGILQSLVGPNPRYDHHALHIVPPKSPEKQMWHADAIIDTRTAHFDVQFFYFAHDTPKEMGGTMILPGSHYRQVNETEISRYQHFQGELQTECKAGTIVFVHHGIWHCAAPNLTDKTRYMFKVRINPMVRQLRLWNTDDVNDPEIGSILNHSHGWYGSEWRIEAVQRIKFWRYLTGNDKYDSALWLGRLENKPETVVV